MQAITGQIIETDKVFLCHKCDGQLLPQVGNSLFGHYSKELRICRCMSGYVREYQCAIPLFDAITRQGV